jgi:uncharacterized protein (TIGR03435 family)
MTHAIINHLWQSTVVVVAAAVAAVALRRNQARTRHAVWLAASLKFLLPFSVLIALGGALSWRTAPAVTRSATPAFVETVQTIAEPFSDYSAALTPTTGSQPTTLIRGPLALAVLWILGAGVALTMRVRGWLTVRAVLRSSSPATLPSLAGDLCVRATSGSLEPGVIGVWRPVLLVPVGLETLLTADQLRAVVAHELHHIRRRDNLTSALHMVVEALFWFHPMVWWIGARLVDERERACDEYVLATGAAPEDYAEGILNVCKRYVESPVACVAGVTGSDLKKRISAIVAGRVGVGLTSARRTALTVGTVAAFAAPLVAGVLTAPTRVAGQAPDAAQKFEVVSVRPCETSAPGPGRRGMLAGTSPGRLSWPCDTLLSLIHAAYGAYANGRVNSIAEQPVFPEPADVPEWIWRDRFTIEAKATGEPPSLVMVGPMLQRVLEDRFKLRVRRETRDAPVYELVTAKDGSKLTPFKPGTCVTYDLSVSPQPPLEAGQHRCSNSTHRDTDGNWVDEAEATTLDGWVAGMNIAGRPVVNKTGITGLVTFRFVTPGTATDADDAMAARTSAMRNQLGLELKAGKAAREFVVIEHAEKPALERAAATGARR